MFMLTAEQKLQAIKDVSDLCYRNALFGVSGTELSYLTQAILSEMKCELNPLADLIKLLRNCLPDNHVAWNHIRVEPTVICINCEMEMLWDQASFCPPMDGWLGHNCCVDANDIEGYYDEVSFT